MSADDTIKLAEQLDIRLARYRKTHAGANPKWVEVNPGAFPALLGQLNIAPRSALAVALFRGVQLRPAGDTRARLFVFVDR